MEINQVIDIFERYLEENQEKNTEMVDMGMIFAVEEILPLLRRELPVKPTHSRTAYFCGHCKEPIKIWNTLCGTCGYKIDWSDFAET